MNVLRFLTAGSVDSGKSTLIGRLLFDSKNIPDDQLQELSSISDGQPNLALVTDGLRAERQQGITIDVAYRYFSSSKRRFIVADAPGHQEFTKNLFTGVSNCSLMVILIEANQPFTDQTRRHCMVASVLQIPLLVAVNKMDAVDFSEQIFIELQIDFLQMVSPLKLQSIEFIPVSALRGDNVVEKSSNLSWFMGKTLLEFLDTFQVNTREADAPLRLFVQNVFSIPGNKKAISGRIQSGKVQQGDQLIIAQSHDKLTVKSIFTLGEKTEAATSPDSVMLTVDEDSPCERGDLICSPTEGPSPVKKFHATLCWFDDSLLKEGKSFLLQYGTTQVSAFVEAIKAKMDINSFQQIACSDGIQMNEIAEVIISTEQQVVMDTYSLLQQSGVGILIDLESNRTVAGILKR